MLRGDEHGLQCAGYVHHQADPPGIREKLLQERMEVLPSGAGPGKEMGFGDEKLTVGQRASRAIKERVNHGKVKPELDRLFIPTSTVYAWELYQRDPQAYYLKQMALAGYDIFWILTGKREKKYPVTDVDFDICEYEEEL